ncbi:MAG: sigma-54-dependent Fis family transcriptional regulator, partial [Gammaproteobacteria bacterium]|nr:sigma-54-dependent Fis family transcriptional regulator [Gammaproteobacteria bacterium]NNJ50116.1 sigma-54-dependent Fis family transcriptional regulator [Gammaproteobacteria bacterium]
MINNLPNCINSDAVASDQISNAAPASTSSAKPNEQATLKDIEAQHISDLLDKYHGNRKKAADALGISERTIYRKLKNLG